jgi:hypothetical protein
MSQPLGESPQCPALRCEWCNGRIPSQRRRGSEARFCSPDHRHKFGTAARRWVALAIGTGLISKDDLKRLC